jgi:hypothetical protein
MAWKLEYQVLVALYRIVRSCRPLIIHLLTLEKYCQHRLPHFLAAEVAIRGQRQPPA